MTSLVCKRCILLMQPSAFNFLSKTTTSLEAVPHCLQIRHATAWKRRIVKQDKLKDTVFQYASENSKKADRVYVWGYAGTGALGIRRFLKPKGRVLPRTKQLAPQRLDFLNDIGLSVKTVGCGYGFTVFSCQADSRPMLYGCGINTDSQLGFQEFPKRSGRVLDFVIEPAAIELPLVSPETTRVVDVSCGRAHTVIVTDKEGGSKIINRVRIDDNVMKAYCGADHTLFLTESGEVYSCGLGADGQTGQGHYNAVDKPTKVIGDISGEKIVSLATRADCVLAISEKGDLFGWGNSEYDQLSLVSDDSTQVKVARHLTFSEVGKVTSAAAAGSMCALLNDRGEAYVWGYGILGKGPKLGQARLPEMIPSTLFGRNELNPDQKVVDLKAGISHFAALTESGELFMWGRNKLACLGLGNILDQYFPFQVQVPAEVKQVACGTDHTIVLCKTFT